MESHEASHEAVKELVASAQRGDRASLEKLVEQSALKAAALVRALLPGRRDREDLVQEVLMKAVKNIKAVKDPSRFGAYLNQIARNLVYSLLRRERKVTMITREDLSEQSLTRETPVSRLIKGEDSRLVDEAVDALLPLDRQIILLRHWADASYEEIARTLNLTVSAVQSRLFRIRKKLKQALSAHFDGGLSHHDA